MGSLRSARFPNLPPKFLGQLPKMAFFGLRFGREVTRNTDARLIHGFCFDNFQSNFVTNAKKGFFPPHMFVLWQNEVSNVEPRLAPPAKRYMSDCG